MATEAEDLETLFRYDPFEESGDEQQDGNEANNEQEAQADGGGDAGSEQADQGKEDKSGDEASASEDASASEKPDESRGPAEEDDEKTALKEQIRQQQAAVREMQEELKKLRGDDSQQQGDQNQSEWRAANQPEDDPVPDYLFDIPSNIVEGLAAEEPQQRKQALQQLVRGLGMEVHARVREDMNKRIQNVRSEAQQTQQETQQQSQVENIRKDYFGQYPKHDSDLIRPVVNRKAQEVFNEWGVREWTQNVRDEIGKRVDRELRTAGFQGEQAQDQGQDQQGADKPNGQGGQPHMRRSGARPSGTAHGGPNSSDDIESTLFG